MTLTLAPSTAAQTGALDPRPALERLGAGFRRAVRTMQYARMREALSQLSDAQLAEIGLTRSDISSRAHACIYDQ